SRTRIGSSDTSATAGSSITWTSSNGLLPGRTVGVEDDTFRKRAGLDEIEKHPAREQCQPLPQHHRVNGEMETIYETLGDEGPGETRPTRHTHLFSLGAEPGNLFGRGAIGKAAVGPRQLIGSKSA